MDAAVQLGALMPSCCCDCCTYTSNVCMCACASVRACVACCFVRFRVFCTSSHSVGALMSCLLYWAPACLGALALRAARFALTSSSSYKDLPDAGWKAALAQLHDDYFYK